MKKPHQICRSGGVNFCDFVAVWGKLRGNHKIVDSHLQLIAKEFGLKQKKTALFATNKAVSSGGVGGIRISK